MEKFVEAQIYFYRGWTFDFLKLRSFPLIKGRQTLLSNSNCVKGHKKR